MALRIEQGRESIMTELLLTMLENLIYDITGSVIKKWKDRYQWRRFLKVLRKDISRFCEKNNVYVLILMLLITLFVIWIF